MKRKLAILGRAGKMGQVLAPLVEKDSVFTLLSDPLQTQNWEEVELVIDFSSPSALDHSLPNILEHQIPWVLGVTGYSSSQWASLQKVAEILPFFYSANFSFGMALFQNWVKEAAERFPESHKKITEIHHIHKKDQPSGTALCLQASIEKVSQEPSVKIHSLRVAETVGIHEVLFDTPEETLLLKHTACSKRVFAQGALKAAHFLLGKSPGLYTMQDLLATPSPLCKR